LTRKRAALRTKTFGLRNFPNDAKEWRVPASKLRFLVVEDHEFQRRVIVQILQGLGAAAVYAAEDGRAALQVVRDPDRPIDIVVTDLSMPGMDGMEFIRRLSESGAHVSVILASALGPQLLASIANMARAYKIRLLGVIGKPPTAGKLVPLIELHRCASPRLVDAEAAFSLDEIAEAWTNNEFVPWYEPNVALTTGRVQGMTASPRWHHPAKGLLPPEVFMPSVAARGLNDDFVWMMIQKAAADCCSWVEQGLDLTVSVRLSFESLADTELARRVRQIAAKEGLDPGRMILSIAEQTLSSVNPRTLENFARLRVDGFGLAIDEFGRGDMAVEQYTQVAFTEIRINESFVTGVSRSETARAGLAVALEVAQEMKVQAIADGVTSKKEWAVLRHWGCHGGQGPFISPPQPGESVAGWVRRWSTERGRAN
jgi:EAL domain-containing protein (putative c-di-GMP-specific phosphodiesterase class I)/CheY-like chemotaxis protein